MKISGIYCLLISSIFILTSCSDDEHIRISGTYKGESSKYLKLSRIEVDRSIFIDSAKIGKSGTFRFKTSNVVPEFYTLGFDDKEVVTLIAYPGDNISIDFEGKKLYDDYRITGSKESEDLKMLDLKLGLPLQLELLKYGYLLEIFQQLNQFIISV